MGYESGQIDDYEVRKIPLSPEELRAYNEMQITLMQEYVIAGHFSPDDDLTPHLVKWVEENSKDFEQVIEDLRQGSPQFFSDWERDPDSVLDQVRERMSQFVG